MFSVLGARLLIEEVHAKSKAAALVGGIVRHARGGRGGGGHSRTSSCASDTCVLGRTVSAASSATADSVADLSEIEEARGEGGSGGRLHRCSSAWSSASTTSIAAFAADAGCTAPAGDALVPMFPPGDDPSPAMPAWLRPGHAINGGCVPAAQAGCSSWHLCLPPFLASPAGRILWMLPDEGNPSGRPQLVETDQTAFERFLLTLETCQHHLPDQYCAALASLTTERAPL